MDKKKIYAAFSYDASLSDKVGVANVFIRTLLALSSRVDVFYNNQKVESVSDIFACKSQRFQEPDRNYDAYYIVGNSSLMDRVKGTIITDLCPLDEQCILKSDFVICNSLEFNRNDIFASGEDVEGVLNTQKLRRRPVYSEAYGRQVKTSSVWKYQMTMSMGKAIFFQKDPVFSKIAMGGVKRRFLSDLSISPVYCSTKKNLTNPDCIRIGEYGFSQSLEFHSATFCQVAPEENIEAWGYWDLLDGLMMGKAIFAVDCKEYRDIFGYNYRLLYENEDHFVNLLNEYLDNNSFYQEVNASLSEICYEKIGNFESVDSFLRGIGVSDL